MVESTKKGLFIVGYTTIRDKYARDLWEMSGLSNIEKEGYFSLFTSYISLLIQNCSYGNTFEDFCAMIADKHNMDVKNVMTIFRKISNFARLTKDQEYIMFWNYVFGYDAARLTLKDHRFMEGVLGHIRRRLRRNGYACYDNPRFKSVLLVAPQSYELSNRINHKRLKTIIDKELLTAVKDEFDTFYVGMNEDTALLLADCVLRLKEQFPHIRLIAVLQYQDCGNNSKRNDKLFDVSFDYVLENADETIIISDDNSIKTFYRYTYFMADKSERAIIIYDGKSGGTPIHTYNYAYASGVDIRTYDPKTLTRSIDESKRRFAMNEGIYLGTDNEQAIIELEGNGYTIPPDALEIVKTMNGITQISYHEDNALILYQTNGIGGFGECVHIYKDGRYSHCVWYGRL